jgi:3-oxoacyl-[acyl-carrier-protein] synthase-3
MLGIQAIGGYLPAARNDNAGLAEKFGFPPDFLDSKIGVRTTSRKAADEETSDLAVKAVQNLAVKLGAEFDLALIQCVVLVTQNPDGHGLPHTSAIVHRKLGLSPRCFAFDISLGCSGFVAGLAAIIGFMQVSGLTRGLLVTADPYSKVIDPEDRNTVLLFGDGAAATLISDKPVWSIGAFDCGTIGQSCDALMVKEDGTLEMNGRAVFDFSATQVPPSIARVLAANGLETEDVDLAILHPGSKYIMDTVAKRTRLGNVARGVETYGNTVSSSIPLLLENVAAEPGKRVLICGFGVGLGWATTILRSVSE